MKLLDNACQSAIKYEGRGRIAAQTIAAFPWFCHRENFSVLLRSVTPNSTGNTLT
jgi:hypothetical protein